MLKLFYDRKKLFENFWAIWFFYLIFPIMSLTSKPLPQMWIGFALLAVFIGLTVLGFKDSKRRLAYIVGLFILIAAFTINYSPFLVYMFFYTIPMIGMLPSSRQFIIVLSAQLFTVVMVVALDFDQFYGNGLWYILPSLVIMFILPFGMRAKRKSRELKEKLTLANDEIARLAMIEERQRISRDLYDMLGHTLSLITLKSELAEKLILKSPDRAKQVSSSGRGLIGMKERLELIDGTLSFHTGTGAGTRLIIQIPRIIRHQQT
jgi:two-component system, NarL family, sensor histidine kinase DesK